MARFKFREGFFLNLGGDILSPTRIRFEAGEQDVPDDLADHWFLAEMGERIDTPEPEPAETVAEIDAKEALRAEAAGLGVTVDKRWGVDRLCAEIAAARSARDAKVDVAAPGGQPEAPPAEQPDTPPADHAPEPEATI